MDKIQFTFPESIKTREDQLNGIMEFLVNRTAGFNRDNFDCIVLHEDEQNVRSFMLHKIVTVVSMTKVIPIYVDRWLATAPWYQDKFDNLIKVGTRKLRNVENTLRCLEFSTACYGEESDGTGVRIFDGFTDDDLFELAEVLYGYDGGK